MKTGKAPGCSGVLLEVIAANVEIGIQAIAELYQRLLDGLGMPAEWALSILVPVLKGDG